MKTENGTFTAQDGTSLYWKAWLPEGTPKAVVHLIHGYAEHIERYGNVVNELVPAGYVVFGNDHRGHGKSQGRRGHVKGFQEFIDDERQFSLEVIKAQYPNTPYFVLGHSMGSLIALNYAEQYPDSLKALVLSGTGSQPGTDIPKTSHSPHQGTVQDPAGYTCEVTAASGVHIQRPRGGKGICG